MKQFAAAILAVLLSVGVLGIPAPVTEGPISPKIMPPTYLPPAAEPDVYAVNGEIGCCHYTPQKFSCSQVKDYFKMDSTCPYQGILFLTKKNTAVCGDPRDKNVKRCMKSVTPTYKYNEYIRKHMRYAG